MMKKSLIKPLLPTMVLAALTACSPPKAPAPQKLKVTVSRPVLATVTNWDEYPGHLESVETVELRPRVPGYIDSIHFQDGAEVKAGDLLFVIDPKPYQADFDRAAAQRKQADTHLELARNDLKRAEGLRGSKAISEEEYDSRSKAVREAEAALAAAQANEAAARINLDFTQVKAPISGRIGRRLVTPGNFVQLQGNGGAAALLATIVTLDPIYCYFDVQEEAFLQYCKNGNSGGGLTCELALVNEEGFPHKGHVDFIDNQINPKTGTIRLRAVFPNADRGLMSGLFANVRVPAGQPAEALLIPAEAIGSNQGHKFVYVVNKDNKAETRFVTTGRQHGPMRAVLQGLKTEDRVIITNLLMVRPDVPVEVTDEKGAGPNAKPELSASAGATGSKPEAGQ